MSVFVIESHERYVDEGNHVVAVRSSMEKAEAYVRAQGKVRSWRLNREGQPEGAFAEVWVGSRRNGREVCFFIKAFELE